MVSEKAKKILLSRSDLTGGEIAKLTEVETGQLI